MHKTRYFLRAFDVPLKNQPVPGHVFTHEEEYGYSESLDAAIKEAKRLSREEKHPLYLFYITSESEEEVIESKSVEQWLEDIELKPLTDEELAAIKRFAGIHGRCWKSKLRKMWMDASASPVLHRLRNSHGPTWLDKFRLKK